MTVLVGRFVGQVYRAHHPRWSFEPASGAGAAKRGGRFNRPGVPALYTSASFETAVTEAHQGFPFKLQPLTIVGYAVDHNSILDLSSRTACADAGIDEGDVSCAWELIAYDGGEPPSWVLADRLMAEGIGGIVVSSQAAGARSDNNNVVFWDWHPGPPRQVRVIDDNRRLPVNDLSWR